MFQNQTTSSVHVIPQKSTQKDEIAEARGTAGEKRARAQDYRETVTSRNTVFTGGTTF
jgi:hypothetical protein